MEKQPITYQKFMTDFVAELDAKMPAFYADLQQICSTTKTANHIYRYIPLQYHQLFLYLLGNMQGNQTREEDVLRCFVDFAQSIYQQSLVNVYQFMHPNIQCLDEDDFITAWYHCFQSIKNPVIINFGVDFHTMLPRMKGILKYDQNKKWSYIGCPIHSFKICNLPEYLLRTMIIAERDELPYIDFNQPSNDLLLQGSSLSMTDKQKAIQIAYYLSQDTMVINGLMPIYFSMNNTNVHLLSMNRYNYEIELEKEGVKVR